MDSGSDCEVEVESDSASVAVTETDAALPIMPKQQCEQSHRRLLQSPCQSVAVQTDEVAASHPPGLAPSDKAVSVLVPREHLALMHKYYVAVKEAYLDYGLTDGNSAEVVRKLFERTPEVLCAVNKHGQTPIESALAQGKWAASAQLLELADRKNPRALSHRTALSEDAMMLAVTGGSEATVRQLIAMGFGHNACLHYNARGRNTLHLCALGSSLEILELLLADFDQQLSKAQLSPDCVTNALRTSDCDGCTPLHYMARGNRDQMLKAVHTFAKKHLPTLDWDVHQSGAGDHHRLTPLAMAAEADAVDACEFLLRSGLAGIDLFDQRVMWMKAAPSDATRDLLAQHCHLLRPLSDLPENKFKQLQDGLRERGLTEEFLLKLRLHWPDLPQLPMVLAVLRACQNLSGSCRLVVWDILMGLGAKELASLLEA